MPGKRMVIKLTQDEPHLLETSVSQGHQNARAITRARVFLLSNDGRKVQDIAKVLGVSQTTLSHGRQTYYKKEPEHILGFLQDKPRSGRPLPLARKVAAHVTRIAGSKPPEGSARWTLHLMADTLVKLHVVETLSQESVRSS
jgi:transposase